MGAIEVIPAAGRKRLNEFVEFPYDLYRHDSLWVPPLRIAVKELLDRAKHPFYVNADAEFFLALRNGIVAGRVAAIVDRNYNRFTGEEAGFFGFFECRDDQEAAGALLAEARRWTFARGARFLRGPVSPSTNYECGMLVDGFESSPMVMMSYNPRYYPGLIDRVGLAKAKDLYAYWSPTATLDTGKIGRVAERSLARLGVRARPIDLKRYRAEVEQVWEIYNSAWQRNWGFVPMTREEFMLMGKEMKQILDPELVLIGEKDGRTVGFALALPDVNQALKPAGGRLFPTGLLKILYHQRRIKSTRVLALGVVEEFRTNGVAASLYTSLVVNAKRRGYADSEMSWILEDNVLMNRSLAAMGAKRYKTYRIYDWN